MKFYRVSEAAQERSISVALVRKELKAGRLAHIRIGRLIRIPQIALDAWLAANLTTEYHPRGGRPRKAQAPVGQGK